MRFDIVTIFADFFSGPLDYGIVRRAREAGIAEVLVHDLREFTHDRHHTVDDRPFGGGEGMLLKPEPLFEAVESLLGHSAGDASGSRPPASDTSIVLLSASGHPFRQKDAKRFAKLDRVILLCGRYEGVDERVAQHLATDEISIGDFVLSGGELAAALVVDAVTRLLPGALGNEASSENESFAASIPAVRAQSAPSREAASDADHQMLLDCPHYTRPADFRGWRVPEVLIGGNHEQIRQWRRDAALAKTRRNRPDLLTQH
ncbi:MAG TPA: tRNA (guanosine(37)-N1)-methyltransferase TrmD [Candidatus Acidoferrales bacterium]|nr:tRNA (guanosine(37)-N1)-methyltransferase TrmD [Candidatus Acidoferrales bacterium]